jgi:hypothetical protein
MNDTSGENMPGADAETPPSAETAPPPAPIERRALAAVLDALLVLILPWALWIVAGAVYAPVAAIFLRAPGDPYDVFTGAASYLYLSYGWFTTTGLGYLIIGASWTICGVVYLLRYRRGATHRSFGMRYTGLARPGADIGARAMVLEADVPTLQDDMRRPTITEAEGAPTAAKARRFTSQLVDAVMLVGAPPWWVLLPGPLYLALPELLVLVIPLLVVGTVAWTLRMSATRSGGSRVATVGQLLTGLVPVADDVHPRIVRRADLPGSQRLPRWRLMTAIASFVLAAAVAGPLLVYGVQLPFAIVFGPQIAARNEKEWNDKQSAAEKTAGTLLVAARKDRADGGSDLVVGQAAEALPAYRARVRTLGITGWATYGWGGTSGGGALEWEVMKREIMPGHQYDINDVSPPQVSVIVREIDGRFVVTRLSWSGPDETGAP